MKNFLKVLGVILLVPYIIIAITLTVFLLNYNEYGVTEIGGKTLIKVTDDELSPTYKKGDLLIVKKQDPDEINANDYIFFYEKNIEKKTITINLARVISKKKINDTETTFKLEGDVDFSSEFVIGTNKDIKVYESLGTILSALESRWVFLFLIIVPLLFIFLYEIYEFVIEVKKNLKEA
ncbi:MAG: hypothetical protein VZS44_03115 [Bacilli bacterium]|nr:hypothetical protein [Bacilli bacterium]